MARTSWRTPTRTGEWSSSDYCWSTRARPAVVAISLLLFPVLRKHSEVLALGYVGFRLMEMLILSVAYVSRLSLVSLSEDYLSADGADASAYQTLGRSVESVNHWAGTQGLIYLIIFGSGSLVLYSALYRSNLVPRWISVSGLAAAVILMSGSVLWGTDVLGDSSGGWFEVIAASPIALVEVTLSMWLIIKGFNQAALDPATVTSGRSSDHGPAPVVDIGQVPVTSRRDG